MTTRIVYRTDGEEFVEGKILTPRGDHMDTINCKLRPGEDLIRAGKPDGENLRSKCIYVWESFESAESNWLYQKDKHLYELEIDEADILHIGNAYLLATIAEVVTTDPTQAAAVVQDYWRGAGPGKRVELLVSQAKVLSKVKDKSEVRPEGLTAAVQDEECDEEFLKRLNHGDE
jgi:hypothetical protein